jgi:ADP-heptose:LPS heptosyltransferase
MHSHKVRKLTVDRLVCLRHQPSDYLHSVARLLNPAVTVASRVTAPWDHVALSYPNARLAEYPAAGWTQCRELEAHRRVAELAVEQPVTIAEVMPEIRSAQATEGDALLICPEAGDPWRAYPAAQLAEAVRQCLAIRPMPVEICLAPSTAEAPWREAFGALDVRLWHRRQDAVALARVIAGAGVVLANETAPAHMAVALDKRGVFLLGGGHYGLLAPWTKSARQSWVANPMECYDCRWNCLYSQPRCITELAPERIAETLRQVYAT